MWVAPGFTRGTAGRRVRPDMTVSARCRFPIVMALPDANYGNVTSARRRCRSFHRGYLSFQKRTYESTAIPTRSNVATQRGRCTRKQMVPDTSPACMRNGENPWVRDGQERGGFLNGRICRQTPSVGPSRNSCQGTQSWFRRRHGLRRWTHE
jgi:hypothetical protein